MTLAWTQVLMLPLDVSNQRSDGGNFNMSVFWQVIYLAIAVMIVVIIPACIFYYESDDDWSCWEKIKYAFCYLLVTIIVCLALLLITYAFLSDAQIPVTAVSCDVRSITPMQSPPILNGSYCSITQTNFEITVSFPIYTIGLISFFSWFLFVLFGGIGIAALPLDLIYAFKTRPLKLAASEVTDKRNSLIKETKRVKELSDKAKALELKGVKKRTIFSKEKREYNEIMRKLRVSVMMIDDEYQMIAIQEELNDEWVLKYYFGLVLGILSLLISIAWFLHILLYFVAGHPAYPFLNNLLVYLTNNNVSFLATGFYVMFCIYLLLASIKGNVKFGLRIFVCWAIHPMKKNETYINSFLFNIILILLCSVSITQFCASAFKDYAVMTDIDLIFSTQIQFLKFFRFFFQYYVFQYILFGMIILSSIYLLLRPNDKNSLEKLLAARRLEEADETKGLSDRK